MDDHKRMKHKTSDLIGGLLDAAVAKAMGMEFTIHTQRIYGCNGITIIGKSPACNLGALGYFDPSSNCAHGGPIIDSEKIGVYWIEEQSQWRAGLKMHGYTPEFDVAQEHGPTRLVAAMRTLVLARLGAEVDL